MCVGLPVLTEVVRLWEGEEGRRGGGRGAVDLERTRDLNRRDLMLAFGITR